ncbi:hypothetical protein C8A00DRAFT_18659 [Chaetomidium leptoderma]|uniref:Uncharacterized protein n=1 Tax=Chaetomidium leptoderma TaxID=669021 RepID=A0AAN6VFQ8_9PEZI|nr:hypothetical protein C8A00DRAFT_18659 [Chaetomidium leptoderma]
MGPFCARDKLGHRAFLEEPGFTFYRFGRTETMLPDGRLVYIGGEHEDYCYPDFFIYNDVVVVRGHSDGWAKAEAKVDAGLVPFSDQPMERLDYIKMDIMRNLPTHAAAVEGASPDEIDIYGYPTDVFPPTDFHTATYYKDENSGREYIYIIGGVGYKSGPHRQATLVHRLDLQDFSIQRLETAGEMPPPEKLKSTTRQGDTISFEPGDPAGLPPGWDQYVLSLTDMRWSKVE